MPSRITEPGCNFACSKAISIYPTNARLFVNARVHFPKVSHQYAIAGAVP
jgi:hypothetical protein